MLRPSTSSFHLVPHLYCQKIAKKLQDGRTSAPVLNVDETVGTIQHLKAVGMAFGIWAALLPRNDPFVKKNGIVYAIHSRTPAKRNHAVTEQDGLGVVWAVQKISPYLYGRHLLWSVTVMIAAGSAGFQPKWKALLLDFAKARV